MFHLWASGPEYALLTIPRTMATDRLSRWSQQPTRARVYQNDTPRLHQSGAFLAIMQPKANSSYTATP